MISDMDKRVIIITLPATKLSHANQPNVAFSSDHGAVKVEEGDAVIVESMEFDHVESVPTLAQSEDLRPFVNSKVCDNWEHQKIDPAHAAAFVRKRQRLTHLTPDEKLKRRKHKNRVAAHLARERRKYFFDDLERTYRRLRYENDGLKSRNQQIKDDIDRLNAENATLQQQLESPQATKPPRSVFGSAEFISGPQQKVQALVGLTFSWLMTLLSSSTSAFSHCSENLSPNVDRQAEVDQKWQKIVAQIQTMPLDPDSRNSMLSKLEKLKTQLTTLPPMDVT